MTREEAINEIKSWDFLEGKEIEAIHTLIPELKESEDERIRKGLIEALKTSKTVGELKFILPEPTREECVAYLEKQKNLDKMIVVSPEVWDGAINDAYENGKKDSEKQKDILSERAKNITINMLEDGIEGIQRELIEFLSNTINASWVDIIKSADAYAQRIRSMVEKQKEQNLIMANSPQLKEQKPWKVGANAYFTPEQKPAESRISEILGDAQPKPALRAELQEIIKRMKEEE